VFASMMAAERRHNGRSQKERERRLFADSEMPSLSSAFVPPEVISANLLDQVNPGN
jgi:hypothetical protein